VAYDADVLEYLVVARRRALAEAADSPPASGWEGGTPSLERLIFERDATNPDDP
jgi:hypothetical protein